MKLNLKQIVASCVGAVIAALIASRFGVQGTVIGVAVGSLVATTATSLALQSIEKSHHVVRQVPIVRRSGTTEPTGAPERHFAAPSDVVERVDGSGGRPSGTRASGRAVPNRRVDQPVSTRHATFDARRSIGGSTGRAPKLSVRTLLTSALVVFVGALGIVTIIELGAGRPLSAIGGSSGSGTSVGGAFSPSAPAPSTTTTTTTTTSPTDSSSRATTQSPTTTQPSATSTTVPTTSTSTTSTTTTTTTAP
jgi:hypothetical protein